MNSSITKKISLVLLIPALASLLGLVFINSMLQETEHEGAFINVAGRQRLLSQQLFVYANMVHMGQERDRDELLETINTFDESLRALEHGGRIMDRELSVLPREVLDVLNTVKRQWLASKPALLTVANQPHDAHESRLAYEAIEADMQRLTKSSDQLVATYETWSDGLRNQMLYILVLVAGLGVFSLFTGAWVVRRYVTDRAKVEKALKDSEERFSMAIAGSSDGIWDWDMTNGKLFLSSQWKHMLGYQEQEIENKFIAWQDLIHPEDLGMFLEAWINYMEGNVEQFSLEYRLRNKDGNYSWILCRGLSPVEIDTNICRLSGSHKDITENKKIQQQLVKDKEEQAALIKQLQDAQDQLLQSEKMASIGQLAAGVAHEINNPVGYISSNLGTLQDYVKNLIEMVNGYQAMESLQEREHPEIEQFLTTLKEKVDLEYTMQDSKALLQETYEGIARVKKIVEDLKDFSHVDEAKWQWADLHKGIDSTLNVVNNEIKYKADVVKEYGDLPQVECLISQLNQVVMNLLVNAAHAIDDKHRGTITVRTGVEQDGVWIEIADSGKGMDKETRKRIFEPFYTTKPVGKGTGLGLSLAYGIIQKHHGTINVESEEGKGARFHIWIPIQQEEQQAVG